MFIPKLILALLISCSAFAEKPFVDMPYSEAIKAAKPTEKLVMIDFYTTWCGPCKMLDQTTWKDEKVQEWLKINTIPLKVDADKFELLAKKFDVVGYPTIVFIDGDEKVVGRFVGYKSPELFIPAAENAIAGITESRIAIENLKKDKDNPMLRMDLANKLVREKKYEEALEQYVWCWEQGEKHSPSFSGVRISFLLGSISRLAREYAPAKEKLNFWLSEAKTQFDSEEGSRTACTDYFSLAKKNGVTKKELLSIYDGLSKRGVKGKEIQSWVGYQVKDEMFEQGRFEDYLEVENIDLAIKILGFQKYQSYPEGTKDKLIQMEVNAAMRPFEALLILKQDDKATAMMQAILQFDSSKWTVDKLFEVASRRDRTEYIPTIEVAVEQQRTASVTDE
jgi:thiol-disulfide isomerase/thioredoxin